MDTLFVLSKSSFDGVMDGEQEKLAKLAVFLAVGAVAGVTAYQIGKHMKKKKTQGKTPINYAEREESISSMFKHEQGFYEKYIKRPLDVCCSGAALVVFSPIMLLTAVVVKISLDSPVIFVQERLGKDEVPFNLLKFRSMKNAFDEYGVALSDQQRLTNIGRIIRKLSLDELPSLINILRGDMSVVGPRPLPTNYGPWFYDEERKRHAVKGGLTGLAQTHGRNTISWEKRFAYDIQYVDHVTFLNDVKIILNTVGLVLKRKDIGERGINSAGDFHVYRSGMTEQELAVWAKEKREKEEDEKKKTSDAECE